MENKKLNDIISLIIINEENCTNSYGFLDEEFLMDRFNLNEDEVIELVETLEEI